MPPAPVFENREEYTHYFQPHDLRKSLMRAYAIDALQLMYDGIDTFENAHVAENLTASKPGKVLGPGTVPPHISAVLFGIWSHILEGIRILWRDAHEFVEGQIGWVDLCSTNNLFSYVELGAFSNISYYNEG